MFDFDKKGRKGIHKIADASINDLLANRISKKETPFIKYLDNIDNIFLAMFEPKESDSSNFNTNYVRHQELKKEGLKGLNRQFEMLTKIQQDFEKNKNK